MTPVRSVLGHTAWPELDVTSSEGSACLSKRHRYVSGSGNGASPAVRTPRAAAPPPTPTPTCSVAGGQGPPLTAPWPVPHCDARGALLAACLGGETVPWGRVPPSAPLLGPPAARAGMTPAAQKRGSWPRKLQEGVRLAGALEAGGRCVSGPQPLWRSQPAVPRASVLGAP